tara:strand:- start:1044 stop:2819 length:1776 start_codon:yes stop_codon:yes gene_type:complete
MTDYKQLARLYSYAHGFKTRIYKASLFSILNKIFDLAPPLLIGLAVDTVVKGETSWVGEFFSMSDKFNQLILIAVATVIIWGAESIFEYLFSVEWRELAQDIQHNLRMDCYKRLQHLDLAYFEDQTSGNLIAIINDDINQLERFLDGGINEILQIVTTVLVIGAIYFAKDPLLAALSFATMPLIIWGSVWFQNYLTPRYKKVREQVGLLTSELNNNLQGMATIKSFAREHEDHKKLSQISMEYVGANKSAIKVSALFTPLIRMLVMIGFLMTMLVGGKLALEGTIEVGTYSVLVFLIQRLLWPLTRLGQTLDLFQRAMASSSRAFSLLETKSKILDGPIEAKAIKGRITFDDIGFSYSDAVPVLRKLSLNISPGESIGLVGGTGSGKSTLIKVLQRFYEPTSGQVSLDGRAIAEYTLSSLRNSMAIVSQDVYLFHGSIKDNIRFAKPGASDDEIIQACTQACADEFIKELPLGYDTLVGERGQKLSGGQKQRLSIARALIADTPIVILDEATSAVDNVTEAKLQQQLEKLLKGKTTIIIAHRLSTVIHCDRIIVLEQGQVSESGSHQELIQSQGLYYNLWNVQTGAPEFLN